MHGANDAGNGGSQSGGARAAREWSLWGRAGQMVLALTLGAGVGAAWLHLKGRGEGREAGEVLGTGKQREAVAMVEADPAGQPQVPGPVPVPVSAPVPVPVPAVTPGPQLPAAEGVPAAASEGPVATDVKLPETKVAVVDPSPASRESAAADPLQLITQVAESKVSKAKEELEEGQEGGSKTEPAPMSDERPGAPGLADSPVSADGDDDVREQAKVGDVVAMIYLAGWLGLGDTESEREQAVAESRRDGMTWLRRAAELGHPYAQRRLARCLRFGQGVTQDSEEAVQWYRRAVEQQDEQAMTELGNWLLYAPDSKRPDKEDGLGLVAIAATTGLPEAQYAWARVNLRGEHLPAKPSEGWKWMQRAADQGHTDAQTLYGVKLSGEGRPAEALKYLPEAANCGDDLAQQELGRLYLEGRGVKKDRVKACQWLMLAVEVNGKKEAAKDLKALKQSMSKGELAEADRLVKAFVPRESLRASDSKEDVERKVDQHPPKFWTCGVCLREDGYFLTSMEVANARQIFVVNNMGLAPARVAGKDAALGVVLLKAEGSFPAMGLGVAEEADWEDIMTFALRPESMTETSGPITRVKLNKPLEGGLLDLSSEEGLSGAPVHNRTGKVLGLVVPNGSGAKGAKKGAWRMLPASGFPKLPGTKGAWHVDRSWEQRLTPEMVAGNMMSAPVTVLGW